MKENKNRLKIPYRTVGTVPKKIFLEGTYVHTYDSIIPYRTKTDVYEIFCYVDLIFGIQHVANVRTYVGTFSERRVR